MNDQKNGQKKLYYFGIAFCIFNLFIFASGCSDEHPDTAPVISPPPLQTSQPVLPPSQTQPQPEPIIKFENIAVSKHYFGSLPKHGDILAASPINVVVQMSANLLTTSMISIMKDNKEYGIGETSVDPERESMRRVFDESAPDGLYRVSYKALFTQSGFEEGSLQFMLDRSRRKEYTDMTGKSEISISMLNRSFTPSHVIIRKGTKVTWINVDNEVHRVRTDPVGSECYFRELTCDWIEPGKTWSFVFTKSGLFPYHCTWGDMAASIIVE